MRHFRLILIFVAILYSYGCFLNSQTCHLETYMNDSVYQKTDKSCEGRHSGYLQLYPEKGNVKLSEFKRYQTFDEFKMKGVGKPVHEPFVFVKTEKDIITVIVSDDTTNVITYHFRDGLWYNHMDFDLWKKDQAIIKSSKENWARSYDRICGNDTIVELRWYYLNNYISNSIWIKTSKNCLRSHSLNAEYFTNKDDIFDSLRKFAIEFMKKENMLKNNLNKPLGYKKYYLFENKDEYWYFGAKDSLCFKKTSLGFFGIQPGFDKFDRKRSSQDFFP